MTNQSYTFEYLTNIIQVNYNNSWLKFIFQFTSLGKLLSQNDAPSNIDFLQRFLASWFWVQWVFTRFLQNSMQKDKFKEFVQQGTETNPKKEASQSHAVVAAPALTIKPSTLLYPSLFMRGMSYGVGGLRFFDLKNTENQFQEETYVSSTLFELD